ncbi:hypothetical protein B0H11DRAFT_2131994 [Mycena galericulata]|nr:hypothetical protein B0H11DRAFT_2131994 [Mycena galericulata]
MVCAAGPFRTDARRALLSLTLILQLDPTHSFIPAPDTNQVGFLSSSFHRITANFQPSSFLLYSTSTSPANYVYRSASALIRIPCFPREPELRVLCSV